MPPSAANVHRQQQGNSAGSRTKTRTAAIPSTSQGDENTLQQTRQLPRRDEIRMETASSSYSARPHSTPLLRSQATPSQPKGLEHKSALSTMSSKIHQFLYIAVGDHFSTFWPPPVTDKKRSILLLHSFSTNVATQIIILKRTFWVWLPL